MKHGELCFCRTCWTLEVHLGRSLKKRVAMATVRNKMDLETKGRRRLDAAAAPLTCVDCVVFIFHWFGVSR